MKALLIIAAVAFGVFWLILLPTIVLYGMNRPLPLAINAALAACYLTMATTGVTAAIVAIARYLPGRK